MRRGLVLLLSLGAVAGGTATSPLPAGAMPLVDEIERYRATTWRWQRLMKVPRTVSHRHERWARDSYRTWIRDLWRKRAARAWRRAQSPPHERAWRCIQRYEAAWDDANAPYYGGLQMDIAFQSTYGADLLRRKGTADRWTPLEQMWVAERALRAGRGFYPWPNTARACGLL